MQVDITLHINGASHQVSVEPTDMLVDVVREKLHLTGTHRDCGMGICGSCTVLVDGMSVSSCILLAIQVDKAEITTIEGLERDGKLHPLQESFLMHGAVQCGFCTPGFLMTAKALLDRNPRPSRDEIVDSLRGNLCRCTGYTKIVDAVEAVAQANGAAR
ncbi:MAG: (2Fe-2S)-binding protein [Alphaproteobacteria bacterium]